MNRSLNLSSSSEKPRGTERAGHVKGADAEGRDHTGTHSEDALWLTTSSESCDLEELPFLLLFGKDIVKICAVSTRVRACTK